MADLAAEGPNKRAGYYDMTCIGPGCFGKIARPSPTGTEPFQCGSCGSMYGPTIILSFELHDLAKWEREQKRG